MNLAIIGYGKMGRAIEAIARERGHSIGLIVDLSNQSDLTPAKLQGIDVAIEFTGPHTALHNVMECLKAPVPVVCGSTGWTDQLPQAQEYVRRHGGTLFYASNFSVGVNLFFQVNRALARLMNGFGGYAVSQEEAHHIHKKDAPSGTAITLCEIIGQEIDGIHGWTLLPEQEPGKIPIQSVREGEVIGTHTITYEGPVDQIVLTHRAKNRQGLALGAVLAAEYASGHQGFLTMEHLLNL